MSQHHTALHLLERTSLLEPTFQAVRHAEWIRWQICTAGSILFSRFAFNVGHLSDGEGLVRPLLLQMVDVGDAGGVVAQLSLSQGMGMA